jgi:hypothetical protein
MKSIEWLAGLLEGEGCFLTNPSRSSGLYTTPSVVLCMTDYDVVKEAGKIFEVIGGRRTNICKPVLPSGKIAYRLYCTGLPAAKIMYSVLPFMGERRALKIRTVLRAWAPVKYKAAVLFKAEKLGAF